MNLNINREDFNSILRYLKSTISADERFLQYADTEEKKQMIDFTEKRLKTLKPIFENINKQLEDFTLKIN